MSEAKKCSVRDGKFVEPCRALARVTEYGNPKGKRKGIYAWAMLSPETGPTRTMFGVKSGESVAKGLLFNFCPFCGEEIDAPFTDKPVANCDVEKNGGAA